ncbi:MAG: BMP family ABC transporter substrate-binding protein [Treponema sp.]|nr:BMP family ABC transporter substrate-binding protein [Treponema sp.]
MKKLVLVLAAVAMIATSAFAAPKKAKKAKKGKAPAYKVAMVTDSGDITDESFNQTTYEAGKAFCDANGLPYKYYKPQADNDASRVAACEQAIAEGANIILCPGYLMAAMVVEISSTYPDVKLVALDVSEFDLTSAGGKLGTENVFCAIYQEELSGYMAGYAAVKMGYKHLGFLGGMAVPAVVRFGYGYVQGINDAAKEMGITKDISVEYVYGNQFYGDADIKAYMDTWVSQNVEVIFACGGGIWTSAAEAAQKTGVKLIGVDVDQKPTIDGSYGEGMTVTSAMKGLSATVKAVLTAIVIDNNWAKYSGKVENLGLVSENPAENFVALPDSTNWSDKFSQADYKALVKKLLDGSIKVSNDIENAPAVTVKVSYQGNIK